MQMHLPCPPLCATMAGMVWHLVGQAWAESMLQQHILRGQVRHAYLFTGPSGVGRRSLALSFAQALICIQSSTPGVPCGTCRNCIQVERMQHPDLSVVQAESVGGVLKVEQVRELQRQLSLAPYEAAYRIALLLRFDEANDSAQNSLLKTLEEPNDKVILLLTAELPENLLPTIVSRCELLHLRPAPLQELTDALVERESLPADQARLIAHIAGGRPGYALHLCHEPNLMERRKLWLDDLLSLLGAKRREKLAYANAKFYSRDERGEAREVLREALIWWLTFWRDVLLTSSGVTDALTNLDYADQVQKVSSRVDRSSALKLVKRLEASLGRLNNANLRLLAEALLLDWPVIS